VTGTLTDGSFRIGDDLEVLPSGLRGRVRGLQTHNQKEPLAVPGSRTAVNISGLDVDQVERGDVVTRPGMYQATQRLDTDFRLLPDASSPVTHNSEVKLFIGTKEVLARIRLIGSEELQPGSTGWLQLELSSPVVALRGDRYILRRPSPGETLGGGKILDPHPALRHKRFSPQVIQQMEAYQLGTPAEVLVQASLASGALPIKDLVKKAGLAADTASAGLVELVESSQLSPLEPGEIKSQSDILIATSAWLAVHTGQLIQIVESYHRANPLRSGMPREELKSRSHEDNRVFSALLKQSIQSGMLVESGVTVRSTNHAIRFNSLQERQVASLQQRFAESPYSPPSLKEIQDEMGIDLSESLIESGRLVRVSPEVAFRPEDYAAMLSWVKQTLERDATLTVAQFRDRFNTSRKYALAFLEHLDAAGITMREGDARKLRKGRG